MTENCGRQTKSGLPCRNSKNCHLHIDSHTCAICLNPVRKTRGTRQLECWHLYHTSCISQWRDDAKKNTCPVCRKKFDVSRYRVTISVENTESGERQVDEVQSSNVYQIFENFDFSEIGDFSRTDINFELDDINDLETLIHDLGIDVEV